MKTMNIAILFTDNDGRARFRDEVLTLNEGTPAAQLSRLMSLQGR